jgi:transposase InsO family protein
VLGLYTERRRSAAPRRRGPQWQRVARELEEGVRGQAVELSGWLQERGLALGERAEALGLTPRTLRAWETRWRAGRSGVPLLGRPVLRSPVVWRNEVVGLLEELGPGVGVATLREGFPEMCRAELADLLRRYRRVWRARHRQALYALHWQVVGAVWAIDFAEAPRAVDGAYPYLLAVRDLASGMQLLWQPVAAATTAAVLEALAWLVAVYGAPLVLKSDNGSAFAAGAARGWLRAAGVQVLFSPAYRPSYNGAIEAGIGSLKARTEGSASRAGRPGEWSWEDVARAQAEANATSRPRGERGPSAAELWGQRRGLGGEERAAFASSVARQERVIRAQEGISPEVVLSHREQSRIERQAVRRALGEHGYLLFSRRRIPPPIRRRKVTKLT